MRSTEPDGPPAGGTDGDSRHPAALSSTVRRVLLPRLGVDSRALAALRVTVGLLLLADLALRSRDLVVFYTDAGVLPRALLREQFGGLATLAVAHGLSGVGWVQGALFVLAGVAAVALLLGYRTRLATAVSLLLLVSLHARNPVLLNAGDSLLRRLLLWGVFLPLGGRWSVDAVRGRERPALVANVATAALLAQVVIVYLVNGVLKLRGDPWVSGEAILLVFELDHLTVGLGDVLAGFPLVLEALGWLWLASLLVSPALLLLRGWPRATLTALFAAMHLGMFLTMRLGLFPLISVAALLPFVPPRLWDGLESWLGSPPFDLVDSQAWRARLDRLLPRFPRPTLGAEARRRTNRGVQLLVAALLVFVLVWNGASLGYVTMPDEVTAVADPTDRRWDMFAPHPRTNDGWFVVPGELESGDTVDAFHREPVSFDRPPELSRTFPSHRWFVYLLELPRPGSGRLRAAFAGYLCDRWNAGHDDDLVNVTIYYVEERARLGEPESRQRRHLGRYDCAG